MIKKITQPFIFLFFSLKGFTQYFDKNYVFTSQNCCTVEAVGLSLFYVDKNGNVFSESTNATQGYPPDGNFKCDKISGGSWSLSVDNIYSRDITDIQSDNSGNIICSGFTYSTFYFNAAHTVSFSNGNFYVKFDSIGNPLWAVARRGNFHVTDKSGGFVSVKTDSTFKYDANGNIVWQKPIGAQNVASSYNNDFYYLLDNTILSKCDTAGNAIWIHNSTNGSKLIADSSENIYIRSGNAITKRDSSGNFIFSRTYTGMIDYTVDKAGNIYVLMNLSIQKYDASGINMLWNYGSNTVVNNQKLGVDRNFKVSYATTYSNWDNGGNNTPLFLPPNYYYGSTGGLHAYLAVLGTRISQDSITVLNTIQTGWIPENMLQNVCTSNSLGISFTVNAYPLNPPFNPLFKVQLSDSSGNFSNAVIIGLGNSAPISCLIPSSVIPGDNYRIRVILADSSIIGIANINGSLKIRTTPNPIISVSNYGIFQSGVYYGCAGTPVYLHVNSSLNFTYQWERYVSPPPTGGTYYYLLGATDSIYSVTSANNYYIYAALVTDTTTG